MERSSNGKTRSSPSRRQQHYEEIWRPGPNQGAIMESIDPSLVGTNIEHEVASAVNIPSMYKNKANPDVKNANKQIGKDIYLSGQYVPEAKSLKLFTHL